MNEFLKQSTQFDTTDILRERVARVNRVLDRQLEEYIRARLIAMGWTPPPEDFQPAAEAAQPRGESSDDDKLD